MLSSVFPSDNFLVSGFTPWETTSHPFNLYPPQEQQQQQQQPVFSVSGSDNSTPKSNSSGSDDGDGDGDVDRGELFQVNVIDERKRRRMISNRESARRSRMRKQKHLENLRNQVTRHKAANRELLTRLRFVTHHGQIIREENERLRSESVMLQQKLWDMRQVLLVRQLHNQLLSSTSTGSGSAWPCNNNNVTTTIMINEQNQQPSLIT